MSHLLSSRRLAGALCVSAALSTSCTESAPEVLSEHLGSLTNQAMIPGYRHSASASRFRLGANSVVRNESGMTRVVGTEGAIAMIFPRFGTASVDGLTMPQT
jgi:hypothetical protein